MKRTFEILNNPEQVSIILTSLRKDNHLSKTFEGTAKNGSLSGFYTNLALINGMVIGYVKIKGQYDLDKGDLKLEVVPSNLYWIALTFAFVAITFLSYKGLTQDKLNLIVALLLILMPLGWTLAFILESKSFIKEIKRILY